jgi:nucleotide-binding universal stress UspA family protein
MERLKILIPTDFSVQAEFAYLMVKKLQEKITTDIHFLHVLNVPDTVTMDAKGEIQTCGEIDLNYVLKQQEIALRNLDNLKALYGNQINVHLVLGKTTDAVLNFSNSNAFDLIVMGTKGVSGLKEIVSGSEAQVIARKSQIPLLSLMCDRSDLQIENVLFVHNFINPKNEGLTLLQKLIKAFGTKVHFLQITSGQVESEMTKAEADMRQFAQSNGIENYACHLINDKDVENGVVHFNQMNNMDLICIGTHGKGGLFHQSATEKLIKHLFKPIISFHLIN